MIYFSRMCSLLIWWCWASTCELSRLSLGIRCSSWHYWYFLGFLYFVSPVCIYVCIYIYIDTHCSYGRYMLAFWYHSGSCVARCNGCHVWCLTKMSCDKYFKERGEGWWNFFMFLAFFVSSCHLEGDYFPRNQLIHGCAPILSHPREKSHDFQLETKNDSSFSSPQGRISHYSSTKYCDTSLGFFVPISEPSTVS